MRFISGRLKLDVKFNDRTDKYQVKICPSATAHEKRTTPACETIKVGLPGAGPRSRHGKRLAVDDPRAMRDAAHAAISFASDDVQDKAAYNRRGSGWIVKPPKRLR